MPFPHLMIAASAAAVLAFCAAAGAGEALLKADFETDPCAADWETGAARGAFDGAWAEATDDSAGRFLHAARGHWQTPPIPVTPFAYYRLGYRAKSDADGYLAIECFTADGNMLQADHYDRLPGSRQWVGNTLYFRANAEAATARVRFIARRTPIAVDDVAVAPADAAEVVQWADRLYATVPPLKYTPPPTRCTLLPRTIQRLRTGPKLRMVLLGDSIANDTSHSTLDVLLQRAWPGCRVELVNSVRGGTGCKWYREDDRIKQYVLPYQPDLLVIAGISHGYSVEAIRDVIRQVRHAGCDAEIMVLTGCISNRVQGELHHAGSAPMPLDEICERVATHRARLRRMAGEERVEFLDVREIWDDYIAASPHPHAWFMRDAVHANGRGKQVVGRILLRYFTK